MHVASAFVTQLSLHHPRRRLMAGLRRYRRFLLLVVLPLVALLAGVTFYLNGGRYVTTDDAYVGAQKVLITPDVSGKIISVAVKEGQQVKTGDTLFQVDPVPYQLALAQARGKLEVDGVAGVELGEKLLLDLAAAQGFGVGDFGVEHHHRVARDEAVREALLQLN